MSFDVNKKVIEDEECEAFVLALLKNGIAEESVVEEDCLKVAELGATIRVKVSEIKHDEKQEHCLVHIQYAIEHEMFDEAVLEGLAGMGKTLKGAVAVSVYNFLTIAFCGFRKCVTKKYMTDFKTTFQGKEHLWHVSDSCSSVLDGKDDPENEELQKYWEVWDVLKRYMSKFLGTKKVYWINVYCARREDGATIGEVRINNHPCRELCNLFSEAATEFPEGGFRSVKRIYYITQDDSTYEPYPHTFEQVADYVQQTLDILKDCVKRERYQEYHKKVFETIKDQHLAAEILAFVPEICARGAYTDVGYAEYIGVRKPSDKEMELVSLSQFTSYYWIEKALLKLLAQEKLDKDLYMTCISLSGTFRAVGELKRSRPNEDLSQEDLCFAIEVANDYEVR